MDLFMIRGGRPLSGRVAVSGSKNASLPIMAASLMCDGPVTLQAVPDLADVTTLGRLLESLGVCVSHRDALTLAVESDSNCVAPYDLVRRMRASICVLGPLLARRGRAVVSLPGGCNIGDRPIDVHLRGLEALGADVRIDRGYVVARAGRLRGTTIDLAGPRGSTVTGTANVLSAAVLARGRSVLRNAAREPETADLANFLNAAGARIDGIGTDTLEVTGVESLRPVTYRVIPDRIEAATLMISAAITRGHVILDGVRVEHLEQVLSSLDGAGVQIQCVLQEQPGCFEQPGCCQSIDLRAKGPIRPVDIIANPYPGFPTDVQAQWTALMATTDGVSRIRDQVFPERFLHLPELSRLGADVTRSGATAIVRGRPLLGANVMASDLRASAALVLAALAAEGTSVLRRVYHLDRGYERLDAKLTALGGEVVRRPDEASVAVFPPLPAA
jgi:UDP-N-acetylglucosamine 1-carboxyvinyltransferase